MVRDSNRLSKDKKFFNLTKVSFDNFINLAFLLKPKDRNNKNIISHAETAQCCVNYRLIITQYHVHIWPYFVANSHLVKHFATKYK